MAGETVQQVMDYLRANPEVARKAKEYIKSHPDQVKDALRQVAQERGWDLSRIDMGTLKSEISKLQ